MSSLGMAFFPATFSGHLWVHKRTVISNGLISTRTWGHLLQAAEDPHFLTLRAKSSAELACSPPPLY